MTQNIGYCVKLCGQAIGSSAGPLTRLWISVAKVSAMPVKTYQPVIMHNKKTGRRPGTLKNK
ncbi:hypothetical protein A8C56_16360 [Niabella ginsenosidivorans]|uniref:Uncharacterized protein n=1 Tax=Niabella ginsenosidivorans TaxID=1176587 RepID=A0A1A9I714_9BACT|nr:hypothetical protein A8C56_16360 [Niabella ginsenosidivorans]